MALMSTKIIQLSEEGNISLMSTEIIQLSEEDNVSVISTEEIQLSEEDNVSVISTELFQLSEEDNHTHLNYQEVPSFRAMVGDRGDSLCPSRSSYSTYSSAPSFNDADPRVASLLSEYNGSWKLKSTNMSISHANHSHMLVLVYATFPYYCTECDELGFGFSYVCSHDCNFFLHGQCWKPKLRIRYPFSYKCVMKFRDGGSRVDSPCDACGKILKRFHYRCTCTLKKRNLHPACLGYDNTLEAADGLTLNLTDSATSRCLHCHTIDLWPKVRGWAYVSTCGTYCYHASCVREIITDDWRYGFLTGKSDPFSIIKQQTPENIDRMNKLFVARKQDQPKRKLSILVLSTILRALTGNPVSLTGAFALLDYLGSGVGSQSKLDETGSVGMQSQPAVQSSGEHFSQSNTKKDDVGFSGAEDSGSESEISGGGGDVGGSTELEGLPPLPAGVTYSSAKNKGMDDYKAGQYHDAIKWLSWAVILLEKAGDNAGTNEVLSFRASCYKEVGEYTKAVADCSKVLEQDGKNVSVLLQRALLYESMEKYKLGAEDLRTVMNIDPGNTLATSNIHRLTKLAG